MFDGADVFAELHLSLAETLQLDPLRKSVAVVREMICSVCKGSKEQPGTSSSECYSCKGLGVKKDPLFHKESKCNTCKGHGKLV